MKLQGPAIDRFLRAPDPQVRAVLVYGPDGGLVRQRARQLARHVIADADDPFRVADLAQDAIVSDPARLFDEAAAQSLTGGRRLIRIRPAGDRLTPALATVLKAPPATDTLIVLEADELPVGSKLRQLFETTASAAAMPCYVEDEAGLARIIGQELRAAGLNADADALAYLAGCLVGDRMVAHQELNKLLLYMGRETRLTLADAEACVGDSAALALDLPSWAAAGGDPAGVDRALVRLFGEGQSPVAVLRSAQRHFQRLHQAKAAVADGAGVEAATDALRPAVFFRHKKQFQTQLRRWPLRGLNRALVQLTDAEADCKTTGLPDQTICWRTLLLIAQTARKA